MRAWLNHVFESSCYAMEEFKQWARDFKKTILQSLPAGCELVSWNRGHFDAFGFISDGVRYVYFSVSDVRHFRNAWYKNILIRTAGHDKDYTGGSNHYTDLPNFKLNVQGLLTEQGASCFEVDFKDLADRRKNPGFGLSARAILENPKIKKRKI